MKIKEVDVSVTSIDGEDYICLTDLVATFEDGKFLVGKWMSSKNTIDFLGLWEQMHNANFKVTEFGNFRNKAGSHNFTLSPQRWIEVTGAIGIRSKSGRYGGTYAHKDIAFEFGTWLSPEFKLLLLKEFQRLKQEEKEGLNWDVRRMLTKVNWRLHTSAVKDILIPQAKLQKEKERLVYVDEAEMFNMIVFGKTSQDWRQKNPQPALRGENIRDHANIIQLTVLSNLESLNSMLIRDGMNKADRYSKLKQVARQQLQNLVGSQEKLEKFEADSTKFLPPASIE